MDWEECCRRKIAKDVRSDLELIKSLMKSSGDKLASSEKLETSEITAVSKISLAYDSLRELLEALSLKTGYKIYNHECYTSFLKEVLGKMELGEEFDEIRIIRNSLNYYGKSISMEEAEGVLKRIKVFRESVRELLGQ